jgi:hypothetical protein
MSSHPSEDLNEMSSKEDYIVFGDKKNKFYYTNIYCAIKAFTESQFTVKIAFGIRLHYK